jgi:hypothetical protein
MMKALTDHAGTAVGEAENWFPPMYAPWMNRKNKNSFQQKTDRRVRLDFYENQELRCRHPGSRNAEFGDKCSRLLRRSD